MWDRVGVGVKDWVGRVVGDEGEEAGLVPKQAERMMEVIPKITIKFVFFIFLNEGIVNQVNGNFIAKHQNTEAFPCAQYQNQESWQLQR